MEQLFASLSARQRPEDVADRILSVLGAQLSRTERALLERAARGALRRQMSAYAAGPARGRPGTSHATGPRPSSCTAWS
ncbi:MAG TPA: hypothetical protein VI072_36385 [Polyangiaceae bacterium]